MIRLLGARKFINLPAGTLYTEYWLKNTQQCDEMIQKFRKNPKEFLDTAELMVYYDNGASLLLSDKKDGNKIVDELILTDINVVGDANPSTTLRVVFDLEDLPEIIKIRGEESDSLVDWTKDELAEIIKEFKEIKEDNEDSYFDKKHNDWALQRLEQLYKDGNKIIDVEINI